MLLIRKAKGLVLLRYRSHSTLAVAGSLPPPPPIRVGWTSNNAGRGVFSTRYIRQGELIHTAEPLIAHPSIHKLDKVCYFCLGNLRGPEAHISNPSKAVNLKESLDDNTLTNSAETSGFEAHFCSEKCASAAEGFCMIERKANWETFHEYCRERSLKYPLLAKRFVCMVISGSKSKDALDILAYANLPHGPPPSWRLERELMAKVLEGAGMVKDNLSFFTDEWYSGILARLHINTFRVEVLKEEYTDLLTAASEAVNGDSIAGSAVYVLPSMYNHNCDPSVHATFPCNTTLRLEALRDIEAGEELQISYIDASMPFHARQHLLHEAYGFRCQCQRCKEEEKD